MAKIYTPQNMTTSEVKKMQQALVDAGYSVGSSGVDGIWGKDTSAALKQFKSDTGGSNTYGNTVGNETFNKLYGNGSSSGNIPSSAYGNVTGGAVPETNYTVPGTSFNLPINTDTGVQTFDQIWASQNNLNNALNALDNTYDGYVTQLQGGANSAKAALDEARANALAGIKSTYDDSARNYYRMYKTQEKELPEQLSSVGATGGASESAALRLMNSYSDNMYKNETARNQDTNALNEDYYNAVANNSSKLASQIADAYMQLEAEKLNAQNNAYNQQASIYQQYLQGLENERATAANNAIIAQNNATRQEQYEMEKKGYTTKGWTDGNGIYYYAVNGTKKKSGSSSGSDDNYDYSGSDSGNVTLTTAPYNAAMYNSIAGNISSPYIAAALQAQAKKKSK